MISTYIALQLAKAKYKILEDKTYFGEIKGINGVWANAKTLEGCREELRDVLESWLVLSLSSGEKVSGLLTVKNQKQREMTYA